MSNKPDTTSKDLDRLGLDIERLLVGFDERDVAKFARNPLDFLNSNVDPFEIRFQVTERLLGMASGFLEHSADDASRPEIYIAKRIISGLTASCLEINDLSKLDKPSRLKFVDLAMKLGENARLRERGALVQHLGDISHQLKIDECTRIIDFIGETFQKYPVEDKSKLAIAFRLIINRINETDFDLPLDQQEMLRQGFLAILENGNQQDHEKAFRHLGKYLLLIPDLFDENLDTILESLTSDNVAEVANGKLGNTHLRFHLYVASFTGRIAEGVRNFAEDVSPAQLLNRLDKTSSIISELANHEDPNVRIELVDELGFVLRKLDGLPHEIDKVVPILSNDRDARVQGAFDRQVQRGFLEGSVAR